jgi:hypothetical protein
MLNERTPANRMHGRVRLSAVLLLALLALSALHLMAPHGAVPSHCMACQALRSQTTGVALEGPARPAPRVTLLDGERADRPSPPPLRLLRPLRAPPVQA